MGRATPGVQSGRQRARRPFEPQEEIMPMINVKLIEGVFSSDQKKEMIAKLTDTMVSIEGENMRPVTWVLIEELASGEWGIGGNALSTEDVKAMAAGVPVS
jgi:4-oxalocrotonate tautomerase